MKNSTIFKEGISTKNPIFILMLGLCSALAITTSIDNAIGMGIAVTIVLTCSNLIVSLLRKLIPAEIRLPIFIIIIATFVSCITMLAEAFTYELYKALGVFLPLITVNCIVMGRAEAFASKNGPWKSVLDGIATGVGFMLALLAISFVRELLGTGNIVLHNMFTNNEIFNLMELLGLEKHSSKIQISLFSTGMGAFLVLGLLIALFKFIGDKKQSKKSEEIKGGEINA
jgi:electron transport complex protein RnfE